MEKITTVKYSGLDLTLGYYYQPYEAPTLEYPGADEEVLIEAVFLSGVDIIDIVDPQVLEALQTEVLDNKQLEY